MTNRIAFYIGLLIVCAMILDFLLNRGNYMYFVARKFLDLVDWVQFWR